MFLYHVAVFCVYLEESTWSVQTLPVATLCAAWQQLGLLFKKNSVCLCVKVCCTGLAGFPESIILVLAQKSYVWKSCDCRVCIQKNV